MAEPRQKSEFERVAPTLAKAHREEQAHRMRDISRCWQNGGYHAFMAGPCFDRLEDAMAYRDREEAKRKSEDPT